MADIAQSTGADGGTGGLSPIDEARLQTLENNERKVTYFEGVSADSGQVTPPTGATIMLNQLAGGVDALVSTMSGGVPTFQSPLTAGGAIVDVSSFDALGNYTLSGTPSAFPVAIIYFFRIADINWSNVVLDPNVLEDANIDTIQIGTDTTTGTPGSVLFIGTNRVIAEDNTTFFWDDSNNIFYVGANSGAFANTKAHFQATVNSYSQVNSTNKSNGNSASTDFIVTADTGTDSAGYGDFGINSSTYNDAAYTIGGALSTYLYGNGGPVTIGTQTAHPLIFHTNGTLAANEAMRIGSDGLIYMKTTTANATGFGVLRVAQGTSRIDFGEMGAGTAAIWMFSGTNTGTNFSLGSSSSSTIVNSPTTNGSVLIRNTSSTTLVNFNRSNFMFTAAAASSGSASTYQFTTPLDVTLAAGTEKHSFEINLSSSTQQHALNTGYALQRDVVIKHLTHRFASATGTITDAYTFYVDGAPVAGTNAAITRAWGLGIVGNAHFQDKIHIGSSGVAPTAFLEITAGTTGNAQINLNPGVAPSSPVDGDIYYVNTNDRLMFRKNATDSEILSASAVTTETVVSDTTLTITYNGTTYKLLAIA